MRKHILGAFFLILLLQFQAAAQTISSDGKINVAKSPSFFRELIVYCPGVIVLGDGTLDVPKDEKCQQGLRRLYVKHICQMEVAALNAANYLATADANGLNNPYRRRVVKSDGPGLPIIEEDNTPFRVVHCPWHPLAGPGGKLKIPNVDLMIENLDYESALIASNAVFDLIRQSDESFNARHVAPIYPQKDARPIDEQIRRPL